MRAKASNSPCSEVLSTAIRRLKAYAAQPILIACTPTLEGILSAIGLSYLAHLKPDNVRLEALGMCQPRLGEVIFEMPANTPDKFAELARRVYAGLERNVSAGCTLARRGSCPGGCDAACVRRIVYACANDAPEVPETVHRYVRLAFDVGPKLRTMQTDPTVAMLTQLASFTLGECERTRQFVRFKSMADGSYFASYSPGANTLPFAAPYFVARNLEERFCVVDPIHHVAIFHESKARQARCVLLDAALTAQLVERRDFAPDEAYVQAMWQSLYHALTLEGRGPQDRGYDLQAHWIPKRLRANLVEMAPSADKALLSIPSRYAGQPLEAVGLKASML